MCFLPRVPIVELQFATEFEVERMRLRAGSIFKLSGGGRGGQQEQEEEEVQDKPRSSKLII